ncbi:hypothetical protein, partial [Mycobacterium xenopi]|uniref:hypothetical protein n=1 Tax=Mycobacterium xenopi TaxID=1789 RepID=UPI0022EA6027
SGDALSLTAATVLPLPLAHTLDLNAGTVDTDTGPCLHAHWAWPSPVTWCKSSFDRVTLRVAV